MTCERLALLAANHALDQTTSLADIIEPIK
jgi:hypothetical protein